MVGSRVLIMLNRAIGLLLLLSCVTAMADQTINLTLTNTLDSQSNVPGKTQASSTFSVGGFTSGLGRIQSTSFSNFDGSRSAYGTAPSDWVYQPVDDYLSVAVRLSQVCGYIYAPFNRQAWVSTTCAPGIITSGAWAQTNWESSIKIRQKMIGGVYRRNLLLGTWTGCDGICDAPNLIYARVYLNYSITVPENCVLNAGDIVTVDFGNISTGAFKTAGAKAEGVNPIARSIALQCSNIQQQASLTMRVQADNVRNDAIVSNNPDVGFVVTDKNDNRLMPNNIRSLIPFNLDNNGSANVTIKTFPVSVTGQKPTEGLVTSRAYLRVDFE